jgi:hypothetical protein
VIRGLGRGAAAALVAGAVLGTLSRGLMALVTLAAGGTNSFSWSGTAFILIIYAAAILPGGLLAGVTTHRLRWLLLAAGAAFLCVPAVGVAGAELGSTAGFDTVRWVGVGVTAAAVFGTIGLLPLLTVRLADRWTGRTPGTAVARPAARASVG